MLNGCTSEYPASAQLGATRIRMSRRARSWMTDRGGPDDSGATRNRRLCECPAHGVDRSDQGERVAPRIFNERIHGYDLAR
jgi:hypothetical protein